MLLGVGSAPPGRALGRLGAGLGGTTAAGLAGPPLTSGTALAVRLLAAPVNLRIIVMFMLDLNFFVVEIVIFWTSRSRFGGTVFVYNEYGSATLASIVHGCEERGPMDQITTPNPKCILYWCLIEFIDSRGDKVNHVGIFDPSFELAPL